MRAGVRGRGGLGSSSTLLRTVMSSIFLRKKWPVRSLVCAGKVLEGEGHGHSEASERSERSGEGREEEKRTPPSGILGLRRTPASRSCFGYSGPCGLNLAHSSSDLCRIPARPLQSRPGLSLDAEVLQDLFIPHLPRGSACACALPPTPPRGRGLRSWRRGGRLEEVIPVPGHIGAACRCREH